ncbi:MAG: hypothetical protein AVO33_04475, partial [delta proteobacterium ML8_F1]
MRKFGNTITAYILMLLMLFSGVLPGSKGAFATDEEVPQAYILGFESGSIRSSSIRDQMLSSLGGEIDRHFDFINASVVTLTPSEARELAATEGVAYLEPDYPVYALDTSDPEWIPWGVAEVFGEAAFPYPQWENLSMEDIKVGVMDTGIRTDHPELSVAGGTSIIGGTYQDYYRHGTHVAGTIAAAVNNEGVVGIAPEIGLYAIKVLNDSGNGSYSDIIEGIEWAIENDIHILNMSLGGQEYSDALKTAVDEAYSEGLLLVAAAGNRGNDHEPIYPAAFESVIAVAASDATGNIAAISNAGEAIELIAPGANILSTSIDETTYGMVTVGGQGYGASPFGGSPLGTVSDVPVVDIGYGNDSDETNQALIDAGVGAGDDWIALSRVYDTTPETEIADAASKGAVGVVVINNDYDEDYEMGAYDGTTDIPAASVSNESGMAIAGGDLSSGVLRIARGRYETMSGTSMASPHVAGVAALVWAQDRTLTNEEVRNRLKEKAFDLGLDANYQGSGLVRADLAMKTDLALKDFTAGDKIYDGTTTVTGAAFAVDTDEVLDLEFSYEAAFETPGVGENKKVLFTDIAISGGEDRYFYHLVTVSGEAVADIEPVAITLAGVTDSRVYDGSDASDQIPVVTGSVVSGEILTASQKFESKAVGEGLTLTPEAVITRDGEPVTGNYAITAVPVTTGVITARDLNITSLTAEDKIYDGTTGPVILSIEDDRVTGDVISYSYTASQDNKDAGTGYPVAVSELSLEMTGDGDNYQLQSFDLTGVTLDILKKDLTVTAQMQDPLRYGDPVTDPVLVYEGFVAGEDEETLGLDFAAGSDYSLMGDAGLYSTTLSLTSDEPDNYAISLVTTTFEVVQSPVTLGGSFTAKDKVYDGNTTATLDENQLTLLGVYEGDEVVLENVTLAFESATQGSSKTVLIIGGT